MRWLSASELGQKYATQNYPSQGTQICKLHGPSIKPRTCTRIQARTSTDTCAFASMCRSHGDLSRQSGSFLFLVCKHWSTLESAILKLAAPTGEGWCQVGLINTIAAAVNSPLNVAECNEYVLVRTCIVAIYLNTQPKSENGFCEMVPSGFLASNFFSETKMEDNLSRKAPAGSWTWTKGLGEELSSETSDVSDDGGGFSRSYSYLHMFRTKSLFWRDAGVKTERTLTRAKHFQNRYTEFHKKKDRRKWNSHTYARTSQRRKCWQNSTPARSGMGVFCCSQVSINQSINQSISNTQMHHSGTPHPASFDDTRFFTQRESQVSLR